MRGGSTGRRGPWPIWTRSPHTSSATTLPASGRRVPEFGRDDLREVIVGAYRIIYWIHDEHIEIVTIFEGHKRLRLPARVRDPG